MQVHGRGIMKAVLQGFAGVAPRRSVPGNVPPFFQLLTIAPKSVVPNLVEMLGILMSKSGEACCCDVVERDIIRRQFFFSFGI